MTKLKLKFVWDQTKEFEYRLYVGSFAVAEVFHHVPRSSDKLKPWIVQCLLPGVEVRKELRYENEAEAMELAEKAVSHWFNGALRDVVVRQAAFHRVIGMDEDLY